MTSQPYPTPMQCANGCYFNEAGMHTGNGGNRVNEGRSRPPRTTPKPTGWAAELTFLKLAMYAGFAIGIAVGIYRCF